MNQDAKRINGLPELTSMQIESIHWQAGENTINSPLKLGCFIRGKEVSCGAK